VAQGEKGGLWSSRKKPRQGKKCPGGGAERSPGGFTQGEKEGGENLLSVVNSKSRGGRLCTRKRGAQAGACGGGRVCLKRREEIPCRSPAGGKGSHLR